MLKELTSNKVIIGVIGVAVLAVVIAGAINLTTTEKKGRSTEGQNQQEQMGQQPDRTADMEAAQMHIEERRRERRLLRSRENRSLREDFDEWLNKITKAYQENDMEKMGQLLEEMQQTRQKLRERNRVLLERWRGSRPRVETEKEPSVETEEKMLRRIEVEPGRP